MAVPKRLPDEHGVCRPRSQAVKVICFSPAHAGLPLSVRTGLAVAAVGEAGPWP
jgi:hypothetical protein